jgi:hypothetical protein
VAHNTRAGSPYCLLVHMSELRTVRRQPRGISSEDERQLITAAITTPLEPELVASLRALDARVSVLYQPIAASTASGAPRKMKAAGRRCSRRQRCCSASPAAQTVRTVHIGRALSDCVEALDVGQVGLDSTRTPRPRPQNRRHPCAGRVHQVAEVGSRRGTP